MENMTLEHIAENVAKMDFSGQKGPYAIGFLNGLSVSYDLQQEKQESNQKAQNTPA